MAGENAAGSKASAVTRSPPLVFAFVLAMVSFRLRSDGQDDTAGRPARLQRFMRLGGVAQGIFRVNRID